MKWEKELKLIAGLAKLYPTFKAGHKGSIINYDRFVSCDMWKAWWVCILCVHHLGYRIPSLEMFIREHDTCEWYWYEQHFRIKN